jgi:hypothetical protein
VREGLGAHRATRAILGHKGATVLAGRMVSDFGKPFSTDYGLTHLFPTPEVFADAKLTRIGLTGARAEIVRALARAVCDGRISFESGGFRGFVESGVRNSRDWKMDGGNPTRFRLAIGALCGPWRLRTRAN